MSWVLELFRGGEVALVVRLAAVAGRVVGTGVGVLFNLCLYGALICLSLFLRESRHESALSTGLRGASWGVACNGRRSGGGSGGGAGLVSGRGEGVPGIAVGRHELFEAGELEHAGDRRVADGQPHLGAGGGS